MHQANKPA